MGMKPKYGLPSRLNTVYNFQRGKVTHRPSHPANLQNIPADRNVECCKLIEEKVREEVAKYVTTPQALLVTQCDHEYDAVPNYHLSYGWDGAGPSDMIARCRKCGYEPRPGEHHGHE